LLFHLKRDFEEEEDAKSSEEVVNEAPLVLWRRAPEERLAVQESIDVALQDFVYFMQSIYRLHVHVMKSLLIFEANAPIQDRLHNDICKLEKQVKIHFHVLLE
jgi:hypothetical protein